MKVDIKNDDFKPLTLNILIETKDELFDLWHRLNISGANVRDAYGDKETEVPFSDDEGSTYELWSLIDDAVKQRNLKRGEE
jgi:hypothetical protein